MKEPKWLEKVEWEATETNEMQKEPNKITMWNAGNGDLYIGICPKSHKHCSGNYLRIERSGGAISRNPRVVALLTELYHELAGNNEEE